MAKLKVKVGESRMDMIRRAQPGDTLVFGNECLEHPRHCFDGNKGHNCFTCCYCSLPNGNNKQFQDQVAEDFKRVFGSKFAIIPKVNIVKNEPSKKEILQEGADRTKEWATKNMVYDAEGTGIIIAQNLLEFLNN